MISLAAQLVTGSSGLFGGEIALRPPVKVAELPIEFDAEEVAEFRRCRGIFRLSLFGSVLRDDFDPDQIDVDVLAEFDKSRARTSHRDNG